MYMKGLQKLKVHERTPILYKSHKKFLTTSLLQSTLLLTTSLSILKTTSPFYDNGQRWITVR